MEEKRKEEYKPHIAPEQNPPEFTLRAVVIGCVLSMLFGAANAYLAVKIGMTICASIPAAVIGHTTRDNDRLLKSGTLQSYLNRPAKDEIYRVIPEIL